MGADHGTVIGALVWDTEERALRRIYAGTVVLATGGYGQLWARTTSPRACSGDGLAAALRAGAQVADLELVQFHPTGMDLGRDPRPLASEALRGAGARLRGSDGEYLNGHDGAGDLAPRDVVSRGMALRMAELGTDHCYLDATMLGAGVDAIRQRFPTFVTACLAAGLSPDRDWVPVSPTTHYTMGGVLTDACGAHHARRAHGGGGGGFERPAWGEPVGLQLAARGSRNRPAGRSAGPGVRRAGGAERCRPDHRNL